MTSPNLQRAIGLTNFRNKIMNGGFDIWQRGTSTAWTGAGYFSADRWRTSRSLGSGTMSNNTADRHPVVAAVDAPNARWFMRFNGISSDSAEELRFQHRIEGLRFLAGKQVTLSFYAKSTATRIIALVRGSNYGSGGSPSASEFGMISASAVTLTTAWQRFTFTFTVPTAIGKTFGTNLDDCLELYFVVQCNGASFSSVAIPPSSVPLDITNVQLEEGPIATPFEQRPVGLELALCQRYYEVGRFIRQMYVQLSTGAQIFSSPFATAKRSVPTMITRQLNMAGWTGLAAGGTSATELLLETNNSTNTGVHIIDYFWSADAEL
jgi:hypothetical protein